MQPMPQSYHAAEVAAELANDEMNAAFDAAEAAIIWPDTPGRDKFFAAMEDLMPTGEVDR